MASSSARASGLWPRSLGQATARRMGVDPSRRLAACGRSKPCPVWQVSYLLHGRASCRVHACRIAVPGRERCVYMYRPVHVRVCVYGRLATSHCARLRRPSLPQELNTRTARVILAAASAAASIRALLVTLARAYNIQHNYRYCRLLSSRVQCVYH